MKIAVVGMGLIGASISRAILLNTEHEVFGFDINNDVLQRADELNAHTRALTEADYSELDLVIIALCPNAAIVEMKRICPLLRDGATVADTCGVKRVIVDEMRALKVEYPHLNFVGTHPMAGKERGGIENSTPDLFKNAYAILVPTGDEIAVELLKDLYFNIGAKGVEICSAKWHDEMIAYTSQLAHAVSSCYVQNPLSKEHTGFSAGSFADLTRVARLNPDMWTELFLQNKDALTSCLDDIISRLSDMREAIADSDEQRLKEMLAFGNTCKEFADGNRLCEENSKEGESSEQNDNNDNNEIIDDIDGELDCSPELSNDIAFEKIEDANDCVEADNDSIGIEEHCVESDEDNEIEESDVELKDDDEIEELDDEDC